MSKRRRSQRLNTEESPLTSVSGDEDCNSAHGSQAKKHKLEEPVVQPTSLADTADMRMEVLDLCKINSPTSTQRVVEKVVKKFVKHDTFWLLDGTTFVQIGVTRFRLHRSTLVDESKWFCDMIEDPPHDRCIYTDEETGTVVYCLDSLEVDVEDFVALLTAIKDAITYKYNPPSFQVLAAILRAADALDFNTYRDFAIRSLEEKWPDDVDTITSQRLKYAADTVVLARRCNVKSILRHALYELVRAEGFTQETDPHGVTNPTLSPSDCWLLIHAREQLVNFWIGKAISPPAQVSTCLSPEESKNRANCAVTQNRARTLYTTLVHNSQIFEKYRYDPMCGLVAIINAPWVHGEKWQSESEKSLPKNYLCGPCASRWRDAWWDEQGKLWDDLNAWFELSDEEEYDDAEE